MFRALTLKWKDVDGRYANLNYGEASAATKENWRRAYWATSFRSLGDAVHLLQDMAQPQHTRNEPHGGMYCVYQTTCVGGHTSAYEKYIDARVRSLNGFRSLTPFNETVPI